MLPNYHLDEITACQQERAQIQEQWENLRFTFPSVDHTDEEMKEFNKEKGRLQNERRASIRGVDAHIDWLKEALTAAAKSWLDHSAELDGKTRAEQSKLINDKIDYFMRQAKTGLAPDTLEVLSKEEERQQKRREELKKEEDDRVKEEAVENQTLIPGTEDAVKEQRAKETKVKGKKAGPVKKGKLDEQIPREDTFKQPLANDLDDLVDDEEEDSKVVAIKKASTKKKAKT